MWLKFMPNGLTQKWSSVLGVAGGDVAGDALVEAELAEQPERGGQPLLAVQALLLDGVELRQVGHALELDVGHRVLRFLGIRWIRSAGIRWCRWSSRRRWRRLRVRGRRW